MHIRYYFFIACLFFFSHAFSQSPLAGKKICIDAGHGGTALTDNYRVGLNGEREEWINLRVAFLLKSMLEKKGATVIMTRTDDTFVPLLQRAKTAQENKVDLFLSIHHNATADRAVNFPIIYFHGAASENQAGIALGKDIATAFKRDYFKRKTPVSVVSDYTIFPDSGAVVLRNTYGIPGVLAEASFFSNSEEELLLKQESHNIDEATAYTHALEAFFSQPVKPVTAKIIPRQLPPFKVFQEAERMKPEAKEWYNDFKRAETMQNSKDTAVRRQAIKLFTRSARSFPDSYVAKQAHENLSKLLAKAKKEKEAADEQTRADEFYVKIDL